MLHALFHEIDTDGIMADDAIEIMIIHSLIFLDARRPPLLDPRRNTYTYLAKC
jgi:hypothetical protein